GHFLRARPGDLFAHLRQPQAALVQNIRRERLLFAEEPEQKMLRSDVLVVEPFGFLCAIRQHPLAFMAEGKVDGSRHLFPHGGLRFDLLANRFHRCAGAKESVRKHFIFPEQAQQQVLRLDTGAAELAGLVSREEDHPPGFFGIAFKHSSCLVPDLRWKNETQTWTKKITVRAPE